MGVGKGGEVGARPAEAVGEVNVKGGFRCGRRRVSACVTFLQKPEQLLPLLLIFWIEVDGVGVSSVSVHGVAGANPMDFAEGEKSQDDIN